MQPDNENAREIADRAFAALEEGDLETAQALALQLQELHFSAYFEIQALIYLEQQNPNAAIKTLREGVEQVPGAWPLWELLGNCQSDQGHFAEALHSYAQGLELDLNANARASLQFNRATVLSRIGQNQAALEVLEDLPPDVLAKNTSLRWRVEGLQLRVLSVLGYCTQVLERVETLEAAIADEDEADAKSLAIFWEQGGRALKQCGDLESAHRWARAALQEDRTYQEALHLFIATSHNLPQAGRYYRVLMEGETFDEEKGSLGFFTSFDVVARVAEEAEELALAMEGPHWQTPPHIEACEMQGECELQPVGVYAVRPYMWFPLNTEDENK